MMQVNEGDIRVRGWEAIREWASKDDRYRRDGQMEKKKKKKERKKKRKEKNRKKMEEEEMEMNILHLFSCIYLVLYSPYLFYETNKKKFVQYKKEKKE